jgi:hypothetical protein
MVVEVTNRLARWLLMHSDRSHSNSLLVTQEHLGDNLGTRRPRSRLTRSTGKCLLLAERSADLY